MKNRHTARTLQIVGVVCLVLASWRKTTASGDGIWSTVLLAIALLAVIGGGVWWWTRRDDTARKQTVADRPGWRTQAVWADATLGAALAQLGVTAGKIRGGTRLTFAWSATEAQLWRGGTVLAAVPWGDVLTVTRTIGQAASTGNPAIELITRATVRIVLVPTRRPDGGMLPASAAQVDALVAQLRELRQPTDPAHVLPPYGS